MRPEVLEIFLTLSGCEVGVLPVVRPVVWSGRRAKLQLFPDRSAKFFLETVELGGVCNIKSRSETT